MNNEIKPKSKVYRYCTCKISNENRQTDKRQRFASG